jgi:hypothetical protein
VSNFFLGGGGIGDLAGSANACHPPPNRTDSNPWWNLLRPGLHQIVRINLDDVLSGPLFKPNSEVKKENQSLTVGARRSRRFTARVVLDVCESQALRTLKRSRTRAFRGPQFNESSGSNLLHHAPINIQPLAEIKFHGFDQHAGFELLAAGDEFLECHAGPDLK